MIYRTSLVPTGQDCQDLSEQSLACQTTLPTGSVGSHPKSLHNHGNPTENPDRSVRTIDAIPGQVAQRCLDAAQIEAMRMARMGYQLFPLASSDKVPLIKAYYVLASCDSQQIMKWSWQFPRCNWGFLCGDGVLVFDIDPRHGGDETYAAICRQYGPLPTTWVCHTGGGGQHHFLKYPVERNIRSRTKLLPGIDIRAWHGYVVLAGSVHPNGNRYEWESGRSPDDVSIAPAPEWLLTMSAESQRGKSTVTKNVSDCVSHTELSAKAANSHKQVTLERASSAHLPAVAPDGTRHAFLHSEATYYHHIYLSEDRIRFFVNSLNSKLCNPPLPVQGHDGLEELLGQVFEAKRRPTRKPGLSKSALKVLGWFRAHLQPVRAITPSISAIAAETGICERQVSECVKKLYERGFLLVRKCPGKPNEYSLGCPTHAVPMNGVYSFPGPSPTFLHHKVVGPTFYHFHVITPFRRSLPIPFDHTSVVGDVA